MAQINLENLPQRSPRTQRKIKTKTHHGGTETLRKHGENQLHRGGAETRRKPKATTEVAEEHAGEATTETIETRNTRKTLPPHGERE
jgi:hypothetical protein